MNGAEFNTQDHTQDSEINNITPELFLSSLRQGKLPDLDPATLSRLDDEMSEGQILEYYTLLRDYEEQNNLEIPAEQILKPKKLYHASQSGEIESFEPRAGKRRRADEPAQVFAAPSEVISSLFLVPTDDSYVISGSYDHGRTWSYIIGDWKKFKANDKGGWIYSLPNDTFDVQPELGLGIFEWTSKETVEPEQKKHYDSGLSAMLEAGVKVYVVDQEMFTKMRSGADQASILSELTPLSEA